MNFNFLNPFSDKFLQTTPEQSRLQAEEAQNNSVGKDEDGIQWSSLLPQRTNGYFDPTQPVDSNGILFDAVFSTKMQRLSFYRSMALYPTLRRGLKTITNEIVCPDVNGRVLKFGIKDAYSNKFKKSELRALQEEFDYVVNSVIKTENIWQYVFKWLVDAEQFWELCPNDAGDRLIGIKTLPAFCTLVIYDEGIPTGYMQDPRLIDIKSKDEPRTFTLDQVAYASYGDWVSNRNDVRGILEPAIRPLNQLRSMEDAMTVAYITRAPEKRIFNIYTGQLPPARVPGYMQEMKGRYRKTLTLDPATGSINSAKNVQALTEDFWFSKGADGNGSTVENMKGSTDFSGKAEDIKMFRDMLFEALNIPECRRGYGAESAGQYSQSAEANLEELDFQKDCRRLGQMFVNGMVLNAFMQQLRLRKWDVKYLNKDLYNIRFNYSTDFERIRQLGMIEKLSGQMTTLKELLPSYGNSKPTSEECGPLLSKQYMLHDMLGWSDEDIAKNDTYLKQEKEEILAAAQESAAEGGDVETSSEDFAF